MSVHILFAVNAVGPLLLLILLGAVLQKTNVLSREFFEQGNQLAFRLLIPCSTYCNLYACPSLSCINVSFLIYGAGIACLIFLLGLISTHMFVREKISRSAAHQCTFRSNIPVLGTALATSLAGTEGAILLSAFLLVIIPLLNIFAVITLSVHQNTSSNPGKLSGTLFGVLKNPLIIACILGFATLLIRTHLTPEGSGTPVFTIREQVPFLYVTIKSLSAATTPVSLMVLGGLVDFAAAGRKRGSVIFGVVWRLFLAPLLAILGAVLLSWREILRFGIPEYAVLLSTFGSSVAVACVPMTAEMGGDAELARQYVLWTNVLLVFSMPVEIMLLKGTGLL